MSAVDDQVALLKHVRAVGELHAPDLKDWFRTHGYPMEDRRAYERAWIATVSKLLNFGLLDMREDAHKPDHFIVKLTPLGHFWFAFVEDAMRKST